MSDLTAAVRSFRLAAWKLNRQRRTLRWRRHQPKGSHYPAIESQQRLAPWGPSIWLPRINLQEALKSQPLPADTSTTSTEDASAGAQTRRQP